MKKKASGGTAQMQKPTTSMDTIIKRGKENGYLTYEELNDSLPDEAISPEKIDEILEKLRTDHASLVIAR